jgi:hypothetical protein
VSASISLLISLADAVGSDGRNAASRSRTTAEVVFMRKRKNLHTGCRACRVTVTFTPTSTAGAASNTHFAEIGNACEKPIEFEICARVYMSNVPVCLPEGIRRYSPIRNGKGPAIACSNRPGLGQTRCWVLGVLPGSGSAEVKSFIFYEKAARIGQCVAALAHDEVLLTTLAILGLVRVHAVVVVDK